MATPKYTPPTDDMDQALADQHATLQELATREEADATAAAKRMEVSSARATQIATFHARAKALIADCPKPTAAESDGLLAQVAKSVPITGARFVTELEGLARVTRVIHQRVVAEHEAGRSRYAALRTQVADRIAGIERSQAELDRRTAASLARLNSASARK